MSAGLFALTCPHCNGELEIEFPGTETCARCAPAYLNRFGHLIPIDPHDGLFEATGDPPTFGPGGVGRGGA